MLDVKFVEENPDLVIEKIASRGIKLDLARFIELSKMRKEFLQQIESLRFELNKTSKQIGKMKGEGKDPRALIQEMKKVSDEIKHLEETYKQLEAQIIQVLLEIPNLPHASVPEGQDSESNEEIRRYGEKPEFPFRPRPHWQIGQTLGILNFELAAKLPRSAAGEGIDQFHA
jgi:seryl-tRNA synthetase